jgi:hypothetical protein
MLSRVFLYTSIGFSETQATSISIFCPKDEKGAFLGLLSDYTASHPRKEYYL